MINDSYIYIIQGISGTLKYTLVSVFFGILIGALIALLRVSQYKILRWVASFYISIFRGTPLLIQLSIVYFVLPKFGIVLSVFMAGIVSFSLNSAAYVAVNICSGIESIDKGQFEAARALSISYYDMMKDIILPQAIRNTLPSLVSEVVNLLKETAIIAIFGGDDLMRRSEVVSYESYNYFAPLFVAAVCYYVLVLIFSGLAKILEKRMRIQ